jgi:hypothetical protein
MIAGFLLPVCEKTVSRGKCLRIAILALCVFLMSLPYWTLSDPSRNAIARY